MLNLIGTGLIAIFIGVAIQYSWTHPKRSYEQKGAALGTIRAAQSVMVVGGLLVIIGIIGSIIKVL
jgi:TRAP-type C4-dicarboxylate transport system permease small subunit